MKVTANEVITEKQVTIVRSQYKSHFFESIVYVYNPDGSNEEFLLIDVQQRLTTVFVLMLAMYNLLEHRIVVPVKVTKKNKVWTLEDIKLSE